MLRREAVGYVATQYDPTNAWGSMNAAGTYRSENLEEQTFQNETFDLVLSQDVFEHIFRPDLAIQEIERTLKPNGSYVMTVPAVRRHCPSVRRAMRENNRIRHIKPEEYHGSPIGNRQSLVTIDWGYDIGAWLSRWSSLIVTVLVINDMTIGVWDAVNTVVIARKLHPALADLPS